MGIFGWSYSPGCNGTPYDYEDLCEVCGNIYDECICPMCPKCESIGDPDCYPEHGLVRTQEQIDAMAKNKAEWDASNVDHYEDDIL